MNFPVIVQTLMAVAALVLGGGGIYKYFTLKYERNKLAADAKLQSVSADEIFTRTAQSWIDRLNGEIADLESKLKQTTSMLEAERKASQERLEQIKAERDAYRLRLQAIGEDPDQALGSKG